MCLNSNINILNTYQTIILQVFNNETIETITYDNDTKLITFSERGEVFIDGPDFMDYLAQIEIFGIAVTYNFSKNNSQSQPYKSMIIDNTLDLRNEQWNFSLFSDNEPFVVEYSALLKKNQIQLHKRGERKNIEFSEWNILLERLKNYKIQVRNYLSL